MPKQETKKKSEGAKSGEYGREDVANVAQFARNCHYKTLLSLLLYVALHCPPTRAISFHLFLHSTPGSDLGDQISNLIGDREYLSFWHGMTWHDMALHQQLGIHGDSRRTLPSISGSESYASPDRGRDFHLETRLSHLMI
jgi:hypothetical protein